MITANYTNITEFTETVIFGVCSELPWFFTRAAILCQNP